MIPRSGILLSAAGHGGLLLGVVLILSGPKPFHTVPPDAIVVDVVQANELPKPAIRNPQSQKPEPANPGVLPAASPQRAPAPALPHASPHAFSMLDPAGMALFNLRLPNADFDAPATKRANLTNDEVAQLRAHLRKCWRLAPDVPASSTTRVVMRIFLARDGALRAEPMLVEASASADGPAIMRAAVQALERCAPYRFLPRERYSEWKVLDIGFSPRQMAGG